MWRRAQAFTWSSLSMTEQPKCPSCGTELVTGDQFCAGCGASLGESAATTRGQRQTALRNAGAGEPRRPFWQWAWGSSPDPTEAPKPSEARTTPSLSLMPKPTMRASLEQSAGNWQVLGVIFLILALGGAIAAGIVLAPKSLVDDGFGGTMTQTDTGAGFAIGVSVFVGSLVTILPYFFFSRVMSVLATLLPAGDVDKPADTKEGQPSDGWS
jgi:VIT1/CCC1 family predicted Fe2+/Mn2+ transporter